MEITDSRNKESYRFSVFTATFNRGNKLKNGKPPIQRKVG